ncbi:DMT family transporter [Cohnella soli]|uniref:DMT family transporter n=1 Tax=Cohnella soli TaxID=425005 RepID=A0ABW0HL59_9BACL
MKAQSDVAALPKPAMLSGFLCAARRQYGNGSYFVTQEREGEGDKMKAKENRFWLILLGAGLCEIGWVSGLKHADTVWEWALTALGIALSFAGLLTVSRVLEVGTTYAVFTGIGAAGTVLAETVIFGAELDGIKLVLVLVLIIGIGGLKKTAGHPRKEAEQ